MTILAERTLHSHAISRYWFYYSKQFHIAIDIYKIMNSHILMLPPRQINVNATFLISYKSEICLN